MRRALVVALVLAATGCGGGDPEPLTVYSGREEELVAPLFERFERETGIDVRVRYGDSAELAATIAEEGERSPADVFFAQDPGSLGALERAGLLATLPQATLDRVDARFRDPDGHWVGTSGRVRVLAYNTERVPRGGLPSSVFELVEPRWRRRVGIAPTNASFQAFVSALIFDRGERAAREWLTALRDNGVRRYPRNLAIVEAVASGEVDVGLVNHYYLYVVRERRAEVAVANHFFPGDDPGALVSVAGAGVLGSSDDPDSARRFVEFLLSEAGQRFYVDEAEEAEYPLVEGVEPRAGLPPLAGLGGPAIELDALGPQLERTLALLNEVGLTR